MRIFLYALFLTLTRGHSQPVIDSANFTPKIWEKFTRERDKFSGLNYWSSGPNYTWNFISAPFVGLDTILYDTVDASSCQETNPVFTGRNFTHSLIGFYSYYSGNGDCPNYFKTYKNDGFYESGYGDAQVVSDYYFKKFPFPMNFGMSYSNIEFDHYINYSPPSTSYDTLYHDLTVDGYGALTLPNAVTYTNCLRIKYLTTDSNSTSAYVDTAYYWLVPGIHHSVLEVHASTPWRDAYYITSSGSVADVKRLQEQISINFSPNPAENSVWITTGAEVSEPPKIFDAMGNEFELPVKHLSSQKVELDLSKLPSGIYFVRLKVDNQMCSRKLIVLKGN